MANHKCPHCGLYYQPISKLKEHRLASGLKPDDIAEASGVKVQNIRAYEEGRLPRASALTAVAKAFGLSVDGFLVMATTLADGSPATTEKKPARSKKTEKE